MYAHAYHHAAPSFGGIESIVNDTECGKGSVTRGVTKPSLWTITTDA